jgi:peptide/nickel transport system substrate-binding protein
LWGLPTEMLKTLPGYGPDVARRRAEARQLMQKLGYGPDNRLAIAVAARNVPPWRDPALILIDQLREIYVDGELEPVDTTQWYPRLMRKDFKVGLMSPRARSTIPMRNSTKTTNAVRCAITPDTATSRSTS